MTRLSVALAALGVACSSGDGSSKDTHGTSSTPLACDVTLPTSCSDRSLGYSAVAPIFERRCVGCHSGDPGGPWPLTSYEHVADWANEIRSQMSACTMPPVDAGIAMPPEEREKILVWVRCGAPK
jgi:uncharacterized membrane protein